MYEDELVRRTDDRAYPQCYAAVIANTPATLADDVYVTMPGVDDEQNKWGPCHWAPRIGTGGAVVLPTAGDAAVVVLDDAKQHWILTWTPYA